MHVGGALQIISVFVFVCFRFIYARLISLGNSFWICVCGSVFVFCLCLSLQASVRI